jgi:hypothetical protein
MPSGLDNYLIGARDAAGAETALARCRQTLNGRADAEIVSDKPGGPIVARLSAEAADQMRRDFAAELVIERDSLLEY